MKVKSPHHVPRRHRGSVRSVPCHRCLTPGTAQAPIVQEARWVPNPGWIGMEKRKSLGSIGVRTLKGPPRSELLC
jgi:hypothetical protein